VNYFEVDPNANPFKVIYIDASHRCNMACHNCFIPNRTVPDIDQQKFDKFLRQLPSRVEIRLFGGEPTLNPHLPEIIRSTRELGHSCTLITNGLKLADLSYCKTLHEAGLREVNVSMNGGTDRELYKKIDNLDCFDRKLQAVENVAKLRMRLRLGSILMKGHNDQVPKMLFELAKKFDVPTTLNFRNVSQVGRYTLEKNENFSFVEMVRHVCDLLGYNFENAMKSNVINALEQERIVLFSEREKTKALGHKHDIWIKITDWSPPDSNFPDPDSKRRGRLTQDFRIAPFFEHVKKNENVY
jgi:molybdenum cofactor biosynthesis enzyme MoaA